MLHRPCRRALAGLALLALLCPAAVLAASDAPRKSPREEREERLKYAIQPRTAETFAKVREDLGAERYAEAEEALGRLRLARLSPFERAQAYRLLGYVSYGRNDNDGAIRSLQKSLAEDALPPADQADVLFQVAQIQGVEQRWKDVIATLQQWFQTVERPNSVGYYLLALSHYQLGDLDAAVLPATKAVQIARKPQMVWLQLLLAIHLTQKNYTAATPVLEQLISLYPDAGSGYWVQLSALYGVGGDNARALSVLELAHRKGLLTDDRDLRRMIQLMLFQGIPHRAAQVLAQEIEAKHVAEDSESLELLSSGWILAREVPNAEAPLTRAAELAAKGDLYVRLAQLHLLREEWGDAASALEKALDKGGLADPSTAQLLLGIAFYNEHKLREARSWFARAQQSDSMRKQAESWIEHVDREIEANHTPTEVQG